jgi:hypothetical protein
MIPMGLEPPKGFDGNSKHNSSGILDQTFGVDPTSCFLNVSFGPGQAYQIPLPVSNLSSLNQIIATASGRNIQVPDSGRSIPLALSSYKSKFSNILGNNPSAHDSSKDSTNIRKDTPGLPQTILVESSEEVSESETPTPKEETENLPATSQDQKKDEQIKIFSVKVTAGDESHEQASPNHAETEENRSNKFKILDQHGTIFSKPETRLTENSELGQSNLNQNSNQLGESVAVFAREEDTLPYDEANEKQLSETSITGYPSLEQVRGLSQIFPDNELTFEGVFVKGMANYIFGKGAENVLATGEL